MAVTTLKKCRVGIPTERWLRFCMGAVAKLSKTAVFSRTSHGFANRSRTGTGNTHPCLELHPYSWQ